MMQQAVDFELKRELADAEVAIKYAQLQIEEEKLKLAKEELKIAQAELLIKQEDLLIRREDLKIKQADLLIRQAELDLKESQLIIAEAELAIKEGQLLLETEAQADKEKTSAKQRELLDQQILESAQNVLSAKRKVDSYDDQLLLKITEMQSNVASFFVNASPAEAGQTLEELRGMMRDISQRAGLYVAEPGGYSLPPAYTAPVVV